VAADCSYPLTAKASDLSEFILKGVACKESAEG